MKFKIYGFKWFKKFFRGKNGNKQFEIFVWKKEFSATFNFSKFRSCFYEKGKFQPEFLGGAFAQFWISELGWEFPETSVDSIFCFCLLYWKNFSKKIFEPFLSTWNRRNFLFFCKIKMEKIFLQKNYEICLKSIQKLARKNLKKNHPKFFFIKEFKKLWLEENLIWQRQIQLSLMFREKIQRGKNYFHTELSLLWENEEGKISFYKSLIFMWYLNCKWFFFPMTKPKKIPLWVRIIFLVPYIQ